MDIYIWTSLIIAPIIGLIPAIIAHRKGYSFFSWYFFGFFLFIVALPYAIFIKRAELDNPDGTIINKKKNQYMSNVIADLANLKAIKDTGALSDEAYKAREDELKRQLKNLSADTTPKININPKLKIKHNVTGSVSTIRLNEWTEMKSSNNDKDYTPILIVTDKINGNYLTFTIVEWQAIKEKGLNTKYKIYDGIDIS